jgi:Tol biopolymer transport system component
MNLSKRRLITMSADYLGQPPPGLNPTLFAPGIISTKSGMEFGGTFSPDGKEFYFTRYRGKEELKTNTIIVSKRIDGIWTEPRVAAFSGQYFDFEPFISYDGNRLFFGTRRPLQEDGEPGEVRQWVLEKEQNDWSGPIPFAPLIDRFAMYLTESKNGNIYYTGKDQDGHFQIFMMEKIGDEYQEPEKLDGAVNCAAYVAHPFIAPDERYLLFDVQPNSPDSEENYLYISFKQDDGSWTKAKKMSSEINSADIVMCPGVSPDGKYLFFYREDNIYWMDARIIENYIE